MIVQKQAIPHLKGLIVGFLNPEDWGRGILIGLPRPKASGFKKPTIRPFK